MRDAMEKADSVIAAWTQIDDGLELGLQGRDMLLNRVAQALREAYEQGRQDENEACAKLACAEAQAKSSAVGQSAWADKPEIDYALKCGAAACRDMVAVIRNRIPNAEMPSKEIT